MDKYEACAALLQYPLISDAGGYAHFLQPDGRVRTFDARSSSRSSSDQGIFRRIQANGVGNHCRWMLTDEALIVRRMDGTYVAKPRPADLPFEGGDVYRIVFSFCADDADIIVLSTDHRTFVVRVNGQSIQEETLALDVRCFYGCRAKGSGYTLVGQTPRRTPSDYGLPMVVSVDGAEFTARVLAPINTPKLESIVAILPVAGSHLLVCAEAPPSPGMEDFEGNCFPGTCDHNDFWLIAQDQNLNHASVRIENAGFVGCVGPEGHERVFFESQKRWRPNSIQAAMSSVGEDGATMTHDIAGLDYHSSILRIQFDPLVGWFGIADQHNATRDRYLLSSVDGITWAASPLL